MNDDIDEWEDDTEDEDLRNEDYEQLLSEIFEAVASAAEGNTKAALWAANRIAAECPRLELNVNTARGLHHTRPADYWDHA
jgi:hypothetical protein